MTVKFNSLSGLLPDSYFLPAYVQQLLFPPQAAAISHAMFYFLPGTVPGQFSFVLPITASNFHLVVLLNENAIMISNTILSHYTEYICR